MSPRARIVLAVIGLLILCFACAALVYAFAPIQYVREQVPIAPTLFAPPR